VTKSARAKRSVRSVHTERSTAARPERLQAHGGRFIEHLARIVEGEGLPRIAGRLLGTLMLLDAAVAQEHLARRLRVSRASISTNGRLLESLELLERVSRPGDRRDYLQISGDPCSALLTLGLRLLQNMRGAIREMRLAPLSQGSRARARLKRMEGFYDVAVDRVAAVLEQWQRARHHGRRSS